MSTISITSTISSTIIHHHRRHPPSSFPLFFRGLNFTTKPINNNYNYKYNMLRLLSSPPTSGHITNTPAESSDFDTNSVEEQGSRGKDEMVQPSSSNEILNRLKKYGVAGILSYGLLNTAYYLTTFLVVWFYVTPSPGRMGYLAAVERFFKLMAMVWAGSQVTKLIRAAGALALAPFVDKGLSWFTVKFGFGSQGKAFTVIAGLCFGLAFLMFLMVTLLWA